MTMPSFDKSGEMPDSNGWMIGIMLAYLIAWIIVELRNL
jgi:hypothetical protein